MRRVALVTGGSGLIGRHVAAPLRALGFTVHTTSRGDSLHPADLLQPGSARALLEDVRPSHVLHCAWDVTHGRFWHAPDNLDWVAATLNLARAAAAAGVVRFVGLGTGAEYDWSDGGAASRTESDPTIPATLYGQAKDATRTLLQGALPGLDVSFAWARVFDLFGGGEAQTRLLASLRAALRADRPWACRHGQLERDFLAAEDVGAALAHLLASDVQGAVNIAAGTTVRIADLVAEAAALMGKPGLLTVQTLPLPGQPAAMRPDVTRLRREVGAPVPPPLTARLSAYLLD